MEKTDCGANTAENDHKISQIEYQPFDFSWCPGKLEHIRHCTPVKPIKKIASATGGNKGDTAFCDKSRPTKSGQCRNREYIGQGVNALYGFGLIPQFAAGQTTVFNMLKTDAAVKNTFRQFTVAGFAFKDAVSP